MNLKGKKITLHDMSLRDGMHPKQHQITLEQMKSIATGLDAAGMPLIEVTHGDGLGGASVNYGFPAHSDEEYLSTVIPLMKRAKVSALLLPGIGTVDHLKQAHELGVHTIRVATHCTEADVSEQHITLARKLGMDTVGFLMMSHMQTPQGLASQAKLMENLTAIPNPLAAVPGFEAMRKQQEAFLKTMMGGMPGWAGSGPAKEEEAPASAPDDIAEIKQQLAELQKKLSKL